MISNVNAKPQSFKEQREEIQKRINKGKKKASSQRLDDVAVEERGKVDERNPVSEREPPIPTTPKMKIEEIPLIPRTPKSPKKPTDADVMKTRVTYQCICNSQIREGINPTVPDQGIVFNMDNNPWLQPDFVDNQDNETKPHRTKKQEAMGMIRGASNGGGGEPDGDDSSDDGKGDPDKNKHTPTPRDMFTP